MNLDVGLQAAVPSYDARYFVYERVAKQGIIHSHEISLKAKSLNTVYPRILVDFMYKSNSILS